MATIYRKYRPQVFSEVYGQDHVIKTLQKALKLNRVAHAYLFCGSRGVGKTTVARLLAKAVNCTAKNPPCGKCSSCLAIAENRFVDLIEIDAASNRGIDEIRQLRDKIQFSPSLGKKRVYIIDEVHMLTREAFNALLKTLEEPPEHTIFIFATTEPHKVPVTVLSRCQRFDFRLAGDDLVAESIKKVAKAEGFKIEDKILNLLVRSSGGSFRDAQSLLDQLSSHLVEDDLTYDEALMILNLSSLAEVEDFIALLREKKAKEAVDFIGSLKAKGVSFPDFLAQTVLEVRRQLIELIKKDQDGSWEDLVLRRLIQAGHEMKFSPVESLALELAAYEICFADQKPEARSTKPETNSFNQNSKAESDSGNLANKPIRFLGGTKTYSINKEQTQSIENVKSLPAEALAKAGKIKNDSPPVPITRDIKQAVILELSQHNKALGILLTDLSWEGDSNKVKIIAQYAFHKNKIMNKTNLALLEKCLQSVLQCKSIVVCEIKREEDFGNEIESVFGQ